MRYRDAIGKGALAGALVGIPTVVYFAKSIGLDASTATDITVLGFVVYAVTGTVLRSKVIAGSLVGLLLGVLLFGLSGPSVGRVRSPTGKLIWLIVSVLAGAMYGWIRESTAAEASRDKKGSKSNSS